MALVTWGEEELKTRKETLGRIILHSGLVSFSHCEFSRSFHFSCSFLIPKGRKVFSERHQRCHFLTLTAFFRDVVHIQCSTWNIVTPCYTFMRSSCFSLKRLSFMCVCVRVCESDRTREMKSTFVFSSRWHSHLSSFSSRGSSHEGPPVLHSTFAISLLHLLVCLLLSNSPRALLFLLFVCVKQEKKKIKRKIGVRMKWQGSLCRIREFCLRAKSLKMSRWSQKVEPRWTKWEGGWPGTKLHFSGGVNSSSSRTILFFPPLNLVFITAPHALL